MEVCFRDALPEVLAKSVAIFQLLVGSIAGQSNFNTFVQDGKINKYAEQQINPTDTYKLGPMLALLCSRLNKPVTKDTVQEMGEISVARLIAN